MPVVQCQWLFFATLYSQWTYLRWFTMGLTSKFHEERSSGFHQIWKVNPRRSYDIDSTWKFLRGFDFQCHRNIDEFEKVDFSISFRCWIDLTSVFFLKITITKIIMSIFVNKNYIYLLQNNNNQTFWCKCLHVQTILYLLQNNTKQKILAFQNAMLIMSWINFH